MSSIRVESPLLQEFRRQPSPSRVSRMPKPRACRKLFAVDHEETDRFLKDELAKMEEEQRKTYGFDFDRGAPLPNPDGSRYTDWEAIPNERVPEYYHETVAKRRPCHSNSRSTPAFLTSSHHQSNNNEHSNPAPPCSSRGRNATPAAPTTIGLDTGSSRSFLPATSAAQCKITDFMRQRKRAGSDSSSSSSVSSSESDGVKRGPIPAKRPRQTSGSSAASLQTTGLS